MLDKVDQAHQWIDDWESALKAQADRARMLAGATAHLKVTARSTDDLVQVTVGPSGAILDLRLDEAIRAQSAHRTARQIIETVQAAFADLTKRVATAMMGGRAGDTPTAAVMVDDSATS